MKYRNQLLLFVFSFLLMPSFALEIKGEIQLEEEWKPVVFLASLNSPEDLFVASPDFVIAETFIQPNGTFTISTSDLPVEPRFYRLYMVKGDLTSVEFNSAKNKNYIHLLLDKNSSVELNAVIRNNSFQLTEFNGSKENLAILAFDKEFEKRSSRFTVDITKAKSDFLSKGIKDYIHHFVDTTKNSLVGLYALYHLDDKDTDFLRNTDFYFDFQKRIEKEQSGSLYAQAYADLLNDLVDFRDMVCEMPGVDPKWKDWVIISQSILLLVLVIGLFIMAKRMKESNSQMNKSDFSRNAFQNLTEKEKEILKLLAEGKTNKEIAILLFVELSTVKTHINSIYKQLKLTDRKEAIRFYNALKGV